MNPDPSKFTFHIGKGLTDTGAGSTSGIMQAVADCVNNGAKIISMSLGGPSSSYSTQAAYDFKYYYEQKGVLIIAAAGNGGSSAFSVPASYE